MHGGSGPGISETAINHVSRTRSSAVPGSPLSRVTLGGEGIAAAEEWTALSPSNGGWVYTALHVFTGQDDGKFPLGNVLLDANGNLYGTTQVGGLLDYGVAWQITP